MLYLYSASENGFFLPAIHTSIPADAVEIADGLYRSLLDGQAAGRMIAAGPDGLPMLVDPPAVGQPVPEVVSRFQARAALHHAGLLPQAEAAVADADPITRIAWQDAQEWRRDSPTIASIAAALGLTSEQVDDLFRAAAQITA